MHAEDDRARPPADGDRQRGQEREEHELARAVAGPEEADHEAAVLHEPARGDGRAEHARDQAACRSPTTSPNSSVSCQISRTRLVARSAAPVTTRLSSTTFLTPMRPISQPLTGPGEAEHDEPDGRRERHRRGRPARLVGHRQEERARRRAHAGRDEHDDRGDGDDDPAVEERATHQRMLPRGHAGAQTGRISLMPIVWATTRRLRVDIGPAYRRGRSSRRRNRSSRPVPNSTRRSKHRRPANLWDRWQAQLLEQLPVGRGGRLALARARLLAGPYSGCGRVAAVPGAAPDSSTRSGAPAWPSIAPTPYGTHFDGSWRRCASVLPRAWTSSKPFGSIHIRSPSSRPVDAATARAPAARAGSSGTPPCRAAGTSRAPRRS